MFIATNWAGKRSEHKTKTAAQRAAGSNGTVTGGVDGRSARTTLAKRNPSSGAKQRARGTRDVDHDYPWGHPNKTGKHARWMDAAANARANYKYWKVQPQNAIFAATVKERHAGWVADAANQRPRLPNPAGRNGYICFYRGKRCEIYADTSYEAQIAAAKQFKAKKSYEVSVHLAEKDGKPYIDRAVNPAGRNGYICFYRGKRCEIYADTSYEAQIAAAKQFKAKKSYEVSVHLAEKDGKPYIDRAVNPAKKPAARSEYEITVGNVGNVHRSHNAAKAMADFNAYIKISKSGAGRAGGEDVVLWKNGEPWREFTGANSSAEDDDY